MTYAAEASIRVNGQDEPLIAGTLAALLEEKAVDTGQRGIAVAVNGAIVPRAAWPQTTLRPGDSIEIVRARQGGFVMTFSCSLQKREKLADQLTLEMNRHLLSQTELRRYDRVEAASGSFTHYTRSTGEQIRCEVLDLSLTGVSVRTEMKPPVGEHILIGHRAGRIARHHGEGIAVEFLGITVTDANAAQNPPAVAPVRAAPALPSAMAQAARR